VKRLSEYVVRFSELKNDEEKFEFLMEDSFFKVYESSEWETGLVKAEVLASKRPDGITLEFYLWGTLTVNCDLCLEAFQHQIKSKQSLFVKYGQIEEELDDDVVVVTRDENQIDLSSFLYEYLLLSIPVKKVHPLGPDGNSGCDQGMIKKLQEHIVSDKKQITDPRWDDLKKLLDKN
jgi:uncharacterized metal-binding protein YceD (DUF177 family)